MTTLIATVTIGFAVMMAVDFITGLVRVWQEAGQKPAQETATEELETLEDELHMPEETPLEVVLEVVEEIAPKRPEEVLEGQETPESEPNDLLERLRLELPLSAAEVQDLARKLYLKGWQFYKKPETLRRKLFPELA